MRAIPDTSVVISTGVGPLVGDMGISVVSLAELHFGVLVAQNQDVRAERLRRLLALQREFDPLPVDGAVAASYGQLAAAVAEAGRRPRARRQPHRARSHHHPKPPIRSDWIEECRRHELPFWEPSTASSAVAGPPIRERDVECRGKGGPR